MMATEFSKIYRDKKVFITGHTGFKGSWLALWLTHLGARVYGYALEPPTDPSLFQLLKLEDIIDHQIADIRDSEQLKKSIASSSNSPHEASLLSISIDKAYHTLQWHPKWNFNETMNQTVEWYKKILEDPSQIRKFTSEQINMYQADDSKPVNTSIPKVMQY